MRRSFLLIVTTWAFSFYCQESLLAYDDTNTHPQITKTAIDKSKLNYNLVSNLGIAEGKKKKYNGNTIEDLLRFGSMHEDKPLNRAMNHFWNPLNNSGLDDLGCGLGFDLVPFCFWFTGIPNRDWAMGIADDGTNYGCLSEVDECSWYGCERNLYTWKKAKEEYSEALLSTNETDRNQHFMKMWENLGRVLHLLEDMGVPAHTRNDMFGHLNFIGFNVWWNVISWAGNPYEAYVKENVSNISPGSHEPPVFARPQDYWDTGIYSGTDPYKTMPVNGKEQAGLAEYSNANFLSECVMFTNDKSPDNKQYFPYPRVSCLSDPIPKAITSKDGTLDIVRFFDKNSDGEVINNFVGVTYLWQEMIERSDIPSDTYERLAYVLNNESHKAYAEKLVPKTVDYAAGLLNHFFRGALKISLPPDGLYAFRPSAPADPRKEGFDKISMLVENMTSTGEQIKGGTLDLIIQYRVMTNNPNVADPRETAVDPFLQYDYLSGSHPTLSGYMYIRKSKIITENPASPTLVEFDLGTDPLPLWAVDVSFSVVYKGKLGMPGEGQLVENDAVCVGYKDASEPTPFDVGNSTDITCIDNNWYNLLNPTDLEEASDQASYCDYEPHDLVNLYMLFSPYDNQKNASPTQYKYMIPSIAPGRYARVFLLTDSVFTASVYSTSFANPTNTFNRYAMDNYTFPHPTGNLGWNVPYLFENRGVQTKILVNFNTLMCDVICHAGEGEETYEGWLSHCPNCYDENCPFDLQLMQ